MFTAQEIEYLTYGLVLLAAFNFFVRNDELLLPVIGFFYSSGLRRFQLIQDEKTKYVFVAYARNIFVMDDDIALIALNHLCLGTGSFMLSYFIFSYVIGKPKQLKEDQDQLIRFVTKIQRPILIGFLLLLTVNLYLMNKLNSVYQDYGGIAFGVSYFLYFGFAIGGFILLIFLSYKSIRAKKGFLLQLAYLLLLGFAGYLTWDIRSRFRFLSWSAGIAITIMGQRSPWKKALVYLTALVPVTLVFSIAGVWRDIDNGAVYTNQQIWTKSLERLESGEDNNMLDGYMMLYQVYPDHLSHTYGMEHFEILLRPIPRAWWKGKPVGSYINKMGLTDNLEGGTVGISPSLYGSFYAEGGIVGLILIAIVYGALFVYLYKWAFTYGSDLKYILKGIIIACTIPLLRGGDLPGVVAFIGMTYWPMAIFMRYYHNWLVADNRRKRRIASILKSLEDAEVDNAAIFA